MLPTYKVTDELGVGLFRNTWKGVKTEVDEVVAGRYDRLIYVGSVPMLTDPILSPHLPNSLTKLPHPHPIHHEPEEGRRRLTFEDTCTQVYPI